jgi:hypothetical protein
LWRRLDREEEEEKKNSDSGRIDDFVIKDQSMLQQNMSL